MSRSTGVPACPRASAGPGWGGGVVLLAAAPDMVGWPSWTCVVFFPL